MEEVFGLIDCNDFHVSCERVFRSDLEGKPVIVLFNHKLRGGPQRQLCGISLFVNLGRLFNLLGLVLCLNNLRYGSPYQIERPPPCLSGKPLSTSEEKVAFRVFGLAPNSRTMSRVVTRP